MLREMLNSYVVAHRLVKVAVHRVINQVWMEEIPNYICT
jgi:hypothetical protein